MRTRKRDVQRDGESRRLAPLCDWREVGCGEYPVFTRPRDGGKPTLHWFETEAEACAFYRKYVRDEYEIEF